MTNQQKDDDSPVEKYCYRFIGKRSRKGIIERLSWFMAADNHEAVNVGGLLHGVNFFKVVKPKFTADFPEAVIRKGADELTSGAHEEGVLRTVFDTTNVKTRQVSEEIVERRRMEGNSLKLDVMQKIFELLVNKRISHGERGSTV